MADPADIAAERTEAHLQAALANHTRYQGHSLTHCAECGEAIPEARRQRIPGVTLCVPCKELEEADV